MYNQFAHLWKLNLDLSLKFTKFRLKASIYLHFLVMGPFHSKVCLIKECVLEALSAINPNAAINKLEFLYF